MGKIRRLLALALLMLVAIPGPAGASVIGIFGDTGATTCQKAFSTPYTSVEVYFCALLDDVQSISAVEFGATGINLPPHIMTVTWDTPLVIGSILMDGGVSLAFPTPKQAPLAYLGKISYFLMSALPQNHLMQIGPSQYGNLLIVDYETATEIVAEGWGLVANCTPGGQYGDCQCPPPPVSSYLEIMVTSPVDGVALEGLYAIDFSVQCYVDAEAESFSGTVSKDGQAIETFAGFGTEGFSVPSSSAGEAHGSQHTLEVRAEHEWLTRTVSVDYFINDTTAPSGNLEFPPPAYQFSGGTLVLEASGEDFQGLLGMTAEFYRETVGSTGPTTDPILVVPSDDGYFTGIYEFEGESAAEFDIGVVIVDAAGNRSPYTAHTVYFYPLNYRITIDVDHATAHDWGAVAGVLQGATDGYDPYLDLPEPPTPPQGYVSCFFPHDEWDSPFGHRFNADVRADTDFMGLQKVWDFTVVTDLVNQPFTMAFSADPTFVDSLPTYVVDLEQGEYYNLHEVTQFTFGSGPSGERHFQLVIGPSEALPGTVAADFGSGWNLLSLPLLPVDPSALAILNDDIGSNYFLYGYTVETGYLPSSLLDLNEGYWLGLFAPASIDVSGSAQVDTLVATLADPWQAVGTGLYKNLALAQTRIRNDGQTLLFAEAVQAGWISPAIYGWDPGLRAYQPADTLEIWRGYWVGQLVDGVEMLFHKDWGYVPIGGFAAPPDPIVGWKIGFQASAANVTEQAYFGASPAATRGFDVPYDYPKPPIAPGGGSVYMSFAHPEWRCVLGDHFNRDIRSPATPGQPEIWTLRVLCNEASTLLTWPHWDPDVPADYQFILDDLATPANEHIDMRETTSYALVGTGIHRLEITAGSDLVTPTDGLPPVANALIGAHPNPFNPTTKLTFTLKAAATVRLDIYGIDGRRVATLADAPLAAGLHERIWDGNDTRGLAMPSGIYFGRLTIDGEVFRTKLVLLK